MRAATWIACEALRKRLHGRTDGLTVRCGSRPHAAGTYCRPPPCCSDGSGHRPRASGASAMRTPLDQPSPVATPRMRRHTRAPVQPTHFPRRRCSFNPSLLITYRASQNGALACTHRDQASTGCGDGTETETESNAHQRLRGRLWFFILVQYLSLIHGQGRSPLDGSPRLRLAAGVSQIVTLSLQLACAALVNRVTCEGLSVCARFPKGTTRL